MSFFSLPCRLRSRTSPRIKLDWLVFVEVRRATATSCIKVFSLVEESATDTCRVSPSRHPRVHTADSDAFQLTLPRSSFLRFVVFGSLFRQRESVRSHTCVFASEESSWMKAYEHLEYACMHRRRLSYALCTLMVIDFHKGVVSFPDRERSAVNKAGSLTHNETLH